MARKKPTDRKRYGQISTKKQPTKATKPNKSNKSNKEHQTKTKNRPNKFMNILAFILITILTVTMVVLHIRADQTTKQTTETTSSSTATPEQDNKYQYPQEQVTEEQPNAETTKDVTTISLSVYKIPNKNAVDIILKNPSNKDSTYLLSSKDIFTYKILKEDKTLIKEGTVGTLDQYELLVKAGEEQKTTFNYQDIYDTLQEGYYTLEVQINSDYLKSKASTTFNVNDFDTTVTAIKTDTVVIRTLNTDKNQLEGVANGVDLITFTYPEELEQTLQAFKPNQDQLAITYLKDKGTYTIQKVEKIETK